MSNLEIPRQVCYPSSMKFPFLNYEISREKDRIKVVSYASVIGSLVHVMLYTIQNIFFIVGMVSRY